jgi:NAD(P)-dependent dehydrogenase (short-subunit alcohol dehydrogenase family)
MTQERSSRQADEGIIALVGATGGIGQALARTLAASGWRLHLGARAGDRLESLAQELGASWSTVDATDFGAVEAFLDQAVDHGGRLAGAACLAGSILLKPAHRTSAEELSETLDGNLKTAFAVTRAGAARMRKSGGSIVLVASAAAQIGLANHEAIAAAKAGVAGLARSAAATYAKQGVRVNAVAPGLVNTPGTKRIFENEQAVKASLAMHPLGRLGEPEDVAGVVAWLLTEATTWISGQVLTVDGGLSSLKGRG